MLRKCAIDGSSSLPITTNVEMYKTETCFPLKGTVKANVARKSFTYFFDIFNEKMKVARLTRVYFLDAECEVGTGANSTIGPRDREVLANTTGTTQAVYQPINAQTQCTSSVNLMSFTRNVLRSGLPVFPSIKTTDAGTGTIYYSNGDTKCTQPSMISMAMFRCSTTLVGSSFVSKLASCIDTATIAYKEYYKGASCYLDPGAVNLVEQIPDKASTKRLKADCHPITSYVQNDPLGTLSLGNDFCGQGVRLGSGGAIVADFSPTMAPSPNPTKFPTHAPFSQFPTRAPAGKKKAPKTMMTVTTPAVSTDDASLPQPTPQPTSALETAVIQFSVPHLSYRYDALVNTTTTKIDKNVVNLFRNLVLLALTDPTRPLNNSALTLSMIGGVSFVATSFAPTPSPTKAPKPTPPPKPSPTTRPTETLA